VPAHQVAIDLTNEFRKLLQVPPVESFEVMTDNPTWADELRRVYDNEVDRVDLTVGLPPEPLPSLRNVQNAFAPWHRMGNPPSQDQEQEPP
jgi:hypothetical protein